MYKSYLANLASIERLSGNVLLLGQRELPVGSPVTAKRCCTTCGNQAARITSYPKRLPA